MTVRSAADLTVTVYNTNFLSFHVSALVSRLEIHGLTIITGVPLSPWLSSSLLAFLSWGARADPLPGWRWPSLPRRYSRSPWGGGLLCPWASWWRRAGAQPTFPIIYWSQVHSKHDLGLGALIRGEKTPVVLSCVAVLLSSVCIAACSWVVESSVLPSWRWTIWFSIFMWKACIETVFCYAKSLLNLSNSFFLSFLEIYAKLKSNSLIQAEPPVLHFSGFELEKDYMKSLVRKIVPRCYH